MSRRIGQNGTIEVRDGTYRGRWLEDVPGQSERVKRSVALGFVKEMTKSEARKKLRSIIEATGINSPSYVIPSTDLFGKLVNWWLDNYLARQKPSTRKTMSYHVRKYLLPKWKSFPVDEITADKVNEWIDEPELHHLSPTSLKILSPPFVSSLAGGSGERRSITRPSSRKTRSLSATRRIKCAVS